MIEKLQKATLTVSDSTTFGIPFISDSYKKPTPKFWRNLGDGILAIGQIISVTGIANGHPIFGMVAGICSVVGKFITNCASVKN